MRRIARQRRPARAVGRAGGGETGLADNGSKTVVYAALAGNLAVAAVKFAAAVLTGAGSMLSEAVHSLVDSVDQVLLLVGQARSGRGPDESHPFGYGLEAYFWSFTVALMVFLAGGAFSVWEGVSKIATPEPLRTPWVNYLVLAVSFLFEGASLTVSVREYRRIVGDRPISLYSFIRRSKNPNLIVTLMEDGAALVGLVLAAAGVAGHALGVAWADGAASIGIGLLLMGVALVLGNETRSLIAGEAASSGVVEAIRGAVDGQGDVEGAAQIATLQLGPEAILVAVTLDLKDARPDLERVTAEITARVRQVDQRIARVYFRPLARDVDAVAQDGAGRA